MRYSGPGFITYLGRPVLQSESVEGDFDSQNNDVNTLLLGRAGHSAGAKKTTVKVDGAIPATGLEFDWVAIEQAQGEITLGFTLGGKTYTCDGDVRSVKLTSQVSGPNKVSFEFHARLVSTL